MLRIVEKTEPFWTEALQVGATLLSTHYSRNSNLHAS